MSLPESLELRLERINRVGDLRLEYLKRLYDGRSIIEGYETGNVELHVHGRFTILCDFDIEHDSRLEVGAGHGMRDSHVCGVVTHFLRDGLVMFTDSESPMLVWIGDGSESFRPTDSVIRLQFLDQCRMSVINAAQVGLAPSLESVWRVLDRELSSVLDCPAIQSGQFVDQEIESGSQMIDDFTDKDRHVRRHFDKTLESYCGRERLLIKLKVTDGQFTFSVEELLGNGFEVDQVFVCPIDPRISAVKRSESFVSGHSASIREQV